MQVSTLAGEEFSLVVGILLVVVSFNGHSEVTLPTGSGNRHHLRRVFSLSVKLLQTLKEPQDASIMEAILDVMGFERYRDAAEWLMNTLERPPKLCYNCREYRKWRFVDEYNMELSLCAGCRLCAHRREGVRVCSARFVGKKI